MSAIASFIQLPVNSLDGLRVAAVQQKRLFRSSQDKYDEYLRQHGRSIAEYPWSGYILATLLPCLAERGIDLMKSEHDELASFLTQARGAIHFLFTHAQKQAYLAMLSGPFTEESLRDYYNEFNGEDEPEAGKPMLDGVGVFRQCLNLIDEGSVVLFNIG